MNPTCPVFFPGQRVDKWLVLKGPFRGGGLKNHLYLCVCSCGTFQMVNVAIMKIGRSKSCRVCSMVKHGLSATPAASSWHAMRNRCNNPMHPQYKHYGGRGIGICKEWDSLEQFVKDMGPRPENMNLDRIDNSLGYSKENCRWATNQEQKNNTSSNRIVEHADTRYTVAELARHLGLPYAFVLRRVNRGIPLDAPKGARKACWEAANA